MNLRRILPPVIALVVTVGGIWIASAQSDPQPIAPPVNTQGAVNP